MLLKPKFWEKRVSATLDFWIFTKKSFFNFFKKSEMLLKPKFWEKRVSATLEFWIFTQFFFKPFSKVGNITKIQILGKKGQHSLGFLDFFLDFFFFYGAPWAVKSSQVKSS